MKATGIVRRIDDLGRVVVPKEIRRTLRIREGDPLEIFTDQEGKVILKKYSPIGELSEFASLYAESLSQTTGQLICVTDKDQVIAVAGNGKRNFEGKPISRQLQELIDDRRHLMAQQKDKNFIKITLDDNGEYAAQAIDTIICEGDAIGSVVLFTRENNPPVSEREALLVRSAAVFLGRQMEQ